MMNALRKPMTDTEMKYLNGYGKRREEMNVIDKLREMLDAEGIPYETYKDGVDRHLTRFALLRSPSALNAQCIFLHVTYPFALNV